MADILASSEAARLCGINFRTVIRRLERDHLRMPGVDGHAVLRSLRQTALHFVPKVQVISADTADRLEEAFALGPEAVLAKPFSSESLITAVRRP